MPSSPSGWTPIVDPSAFGPSYTFDPAGGPPDTMQAPDNAMPKPDLTNELRPDGSSDQTVDPTQPEGKTLTQDELTNLVFMLSSCINDSTGKLKQDCFDNALAAIGCTGECRQQVIDYIRAYQPGMWPPESGGGHTVPDVNPVEAALAAVRFCVDPGTGRLKRTCFEEALRNVGCTGECRTQVINQIQWMSKDMWPPIEDDDASLIAAVLAGCEQPVTDECARRVLEGISPECAADPSCLGRIMHGAARPPATTVDEAAIAAAVRARCQSPMTDECIRSAIVSVAPGCAADPACVERITQQVKEGAPSTRVGEQGSSGAATAGLVIVGLLTLGGIAWALNARKSR